MPDPFIDVVFSGPPSEPAYLVEVENPAGASISVGSWLQRPDGYWVLRIPVGSEHDRQVAERAWDEGAWMGHHLYDKPIQEVKAHSPYRAAKGEQK